MVRKTCLPKTTAPGHKKKRKKETKTGIRSGFQGKNQLSRDRCFEGPGSAGTFQARRCFDAEIPHPQRVLEPFGFLTEAVHHSRSVN